MAAALAPTALCRDWTANVAADMSHFSPRTKSTFGELPMADHHFVTDYNKIVKDLIEIKPLDEAMSDAVGGNYELFGKITLSIILSAGLTQGMTLVDFGCGSGRLGSELGKSLLEVDYLGIDVVQDLLDYAKLKTPSNYIYKLNQSLYIPAPDNFADVIAVFSVFTHLRHSETFQYLTEMKRILRPGGKIVFSFLEFADPGHWQTFEITVNTLLHGEHDQLNQFIERNQITTWAANSDAIRPPIPI
jgi:ubiquinone/menaquinone biosynthesis C-methylase UbiE